MPIGMLFWFLMLLWLFWGVWWNSPFQRTNYGFFGGHILLWVVIALLGWHDFGFPIHA